MWHVRNGVSLAVAALALTVGCHPNNGSASTDSANGSVSSSPGIPSDSTAMAMPQVSAAIPSTMPVDTGAISSSAPGSSSDAAILSTAAGADSAEILVGRFVETMATKPSVKDYARMLVTDHSHDLRQVDSTSSTLSFGTPMVSTQVAANNLIAQLRATPKGVAFDSAFVNAMVTGHKAALITARKNESAAHNLQVKAALRKQIAIMQKHLDRGEALQTELAK